MSNTKIATLTTNSSGQATSGMIPSGNYYVMETKAPTGYVLDSTKYNITVGTTMQTHSVTMSNTKIRGRVKLIKKDDANNLLVGAVFGVYDSSDDLIEQLTSNASGVDTSSLLEYGSY